MPNYNTENGIRFGVISPHAINQDALNDIYTNGTDPYFEEGKKEFTFGLFYQISEYCKSQGIHIEESEIDMDSIIQHWVDRYENPDGTMDYSDKEYTLHVSGDNFGIFVMRSPYYTFCRPCSPCAPGAGDLDNPSDLHTFRIEGSKQVDYPGHAEKTLCLGPEWFDQSDNQYARKIPYRVFRVDNDEEVI